MSSFSIGRQGIALAVACLLGSVAYGQPVHDNYANRKIVVPPLPFSDVETTIGLATIEPTDPAIFCRQAGVGTGGNTVWYSYTTGPVDEYLDFDTHRNSSDYDTIVAFFTGGPGAFTLVGGGCDDDGGDMGYARVTGFRARANTTYSIVVARPTQSPAAATLRVYFGPAATYQVTKTADTSDGACSTDDCSLREAISASNTIRGAVLVPAGTYVLSLPGVENNNAGGDLDVRAGTNIYGAGAANTIVDGDGIDRVMDLDPQNSNSVSVLISGLTLRNGDTAARGGGLFMTGTLDFLTLEDVNITDNVAGTDGGGLSLDSIALLRRINVTSNQAGTSGGGVNLSGSGRAIEIRDSTISNNASLDQSSQGGGGIRSQSQLRLDQVTVSGNTANLGGGGIFFSGGSLVMRNTTVVANVADADNNDASVGGGLYLNSGVADIANSVIALNRAYGGLPSDLNDCRIASATLTAVYNHVMNKENCLFDPSGNNTDITDPLLGPLADNGGPTKTHAIMPGSVLINTGNPAGCLDDSDVAFANDQRGPGFPRPIGICDKGAYESSTVPVELMGFTLE